MSDRAARTAERTIEPVTSEERAQVLGCITGAFICDPLARFAWPAAHSYLDAMPSLAGVFARDSLAGGSAFRTPDCRGAALWLRPGVSPDFGAVVALLQETVPAKQLDDLLRTLDEMDRWRPAQPHWYLAMVGVDPPYHGRGLGSRLLERALACCDRDRVPAYLESSNARNLPFYRRHGFEVLATIQIGAAPPVRPMLREPRVPV